MTDEQTQTCPFCAMDVSPGVTMCPNCGGLISPAKSVASEYESKAEQTPSVGQPLGSAPAWTPPTSTRPAGSKFVLLGVGAAVALLVTGGVAVSYFVSQQGGGPGGLSDDPPPIFINANEPIMGNLDSSNPTRLYEFRLTRRGIVNIRVTGDFDNYLELYREGESSPLDEDDDSAGDLNAQVTNTLTPGTYYALVRPYSSGTTGSFTIHITAPGEQRGRIDGTPPPPPPPTGQPVPQQHRTGVVAAVSGSAPVSASQDCEIYITPSESGSSFNCRVRVHCGGSIIYGRDQGSTRYGYNNCSVLNVAGGSVVIEAHDRGTTPTDGDPRIDLNTAQGEISVIDQGATGQWSATIRFTSPADNAAPPTGQ